MSVTTGSFQAVPVTLEGRHVRLEPLSRAHVPGLVDSGALDPELWRWTTARIENVADLERYVDVALREREEARSVPFATMDPSSGRPIGCTRFGNIEPTHRRVEIGWTWITPPWQRTAVNTEAKFLMLRHAFETWGCMRVELKTNVLNQRSRNAMLRIGATEEGVLRKHMVSERGVPRDTIFFSVLDDEWPGVKARLERLMARD